MPHPKRRGKPVCLTIEHEAVDILKALCPSGKGYGLFLSHLIRQEEHRRIEARKWRQTQAELVEVGDE